MCRCRSVIPALVPGVKPATQSCSTYTDSIKACTCTIMSYLGCILYIEVQPNLSSWTPWKSGNLRTEDTSVQSPRVCMGICMQCLSKMRIPVNCDYEFRAHECCPADVSHTASRHTCQMGTPSVYLHVSVLEKHVQGVMYRV